jgi:hypothetical protein
MAPKGAALLQRQKIADEEAAQCGNAKIGATDNSKTNNCYREELEKGRKE